MGAKNGRIDVLLFSIVCCSVVLHAEGYANYTVGGSLGWYDKLEQPEVDYQKWASTTNFSLGDFLIFNTDRNHSVIQTYNVTTYNNCNYDDAQDNDTVQWSASTPTVDKTPVTVAVPLVKEGMNYFFSGNYDGEQCLNGQRFKISVSHGKGLPESLRPESPAPSSAGDDGSTTNDDSGHFNFNNPLEATNASSEASGALDLAVGSGSWSVFLVSLFMLYW